MPSNDWLLSPIEIKSLERARGEEVAPSHLHFWRFDTTGGLRLLSEPSEIPGIDIVALPAGKFLPEDFGTLRRLPAHEYLRSWAHLADVPPQAPVVPPLIDAPDNPIPAPVHDAEVVELVPKASPDPLRPKGVELDRDAVLLDLAAHRAKRETATEIVHRIHKERMANIPQHDPKPLPREPKPAVMQAMPPQWKPHP